MSPPPSGAPWRSAFLSNVETMDSPEFNLATLRRASGAGARERRSSILTAPQYYPRSRTCIFRGLLANMDVNPKNDAELNPKGVWESDILTFTTDVRMDKMAELVSVFFPSLILCRSHPLQRQTDAHVSAFEVIAKAEKSELCAWEDGIDLDLRSARGSDPKSPTTGMVGEELWEEGLRRERGKKTPEVPIKTREEKLKGSGGGAVVEATFWTSKPAVQWRVRGRAYVLAPDIESSSEGREVMALLKSRMRRQGGDKNWSFAREITAHFGNLSPMMRGTFRNPPPGRPVSQPVEGDGLALGQQVTDLDDPVARANFRVVVIVPDEIDQTDLSDPEHGRRWLHTYVGVMHGKGQGEWETVEVWP
ncbi:pyridoxamine 5'-phosphate oxidase-domain-containing protein [Astrocystis sublimbata]|nr:pyridoxamine 5'-phosphate oxidase-domain-containing protein [Astrocystis sublimbata]